MMCWRRKILYVRTDRLVYPKFLGKLIRVSQESHKGLTKVLLNQGYKNGFYVQSDMGKSYWSLLNIGRLLVWKVTKGADVSLYSKFFFHMLETNYRVMPIHPDGATYFFIA